MFLVCCPPQQHIIVCVLQFIEDNSVLVGVVTSVIASSLWLRKFLRQKRAEAFFGFYAKLSLCLKSLQVKLKEKELLNTSDSEAGNIYSIIYTDDCITTTCPRFAEPTPTEIQLYQEAAKQLKDTLLTTESNVYPQGADRKKWYESLYILFSFCEFLEKWDSIQKTNKCRAADETEDKHIIKCRLLVDAIDYVQSSIDNAKY